MATMRVIITGAGRLGVETATALTAARHEVSLIDIDDELVERLKASLKCQVLWGDACDPNVLEGSGALKADVLVATTGDDEDNLVTSLLAKRHFDIPRIVARVNNPENHWLFDEHWGVDVALSASSTLLSLVVEATGSADTIGLLQLARAGVKLIETTIGAHSDTVGRTLSEITMPTGTMIAAVVRDGEPNVPGGSFQLAPGDEVILVTESATEADIERLFQHSTSNLRNN
jgi:trk system potassium uptake protein TrkA